VAASPRLPGLADGHCAGLVSTTCSALKLLELSALGDVFEMRNSAGILECTIGKHETVTVRQYLKLGQRTTAPQRVDAPEGFHNRDNIRPRPSTSARAAGRKSIIRY